MYSCEVKPFGATAAGEPVSLIALKNEYLEAGILTYGGALAYLRTADRRGAMTDVVLGFDTLADYEKQEKYVGALIGRHANRIGGARFTLNGREYALSANEGKNQLHGGFRGFDKRVWRAAPAGRGVALALDSPDGEEGFPGALSVQVTYSLEENALSVRYLARSGADTVCNLTNHAYFNLGGHDSGPVLEQQVRLFADFFTPADAESLPVGRLEAVEGTPMDLRALTPIGAHIGEDFEQLRLVGGYDHNWAVNGPTGVLRPAAGAWCPRTGILMQVNTTLPGIQLYTANFLEPCPPGKGGAVYANRHAFCLETQFFPNALNCPGFAQPVLRAGEAYDHTTVFRFGIKER